MRATIILLLACLVATVALRAYGQELQPSSSTAIGVMSEARRDNENTVIEKRHLRLWKWSLVALVACTAFDAATSMNNSEANPILRSSNGQFGYRGLLLKSALASGTIAFEFRFGKRGGMYKPLAIFNFVQAGVFAGAATYNSTFLGH